MFLGTRVMSSDLRRARPLRSSFGGALQFLLLTPQVVSRMSLPRFGKDTSLARACFLKHEG